MPKLRHRWGSFRSLDICPIYMSLNQSRILIFLPVHHFCSCKWVHSAAKPPGKFHFLNINFHFQKVNFHSTASGLSFSAGLLLSPYKVTRFRRPPPPEWKFPIPKYGGTGKWWVWMEMFVNGSCKWDQICGNFLREDFCKFWQGSCKIVIVSHFQFHLLGI